jgi:hypothetical protein
MFKMLNNSCNFYSGQRYGFFLYFQIDFLNIVGRGAFVVECELCVYGQEIGESERITRICFAHN